MQVGQKQEREIIIDSLLDELKKMSFVEKEEVNETSQDFFLPEEVLCHVFSFLRVGDLRKFLLVSKEYARFANDPLLLNGSIRQHYPFMCALDKDISPFKLLKKKHKLIERIKTCNVDTQTSEVTKLTAIYVRAGKESEAMADFVSFIPYEYEELQKIAPIIKRHSKSFVYLCVPMAKSLFGCIITDIDKRENKTLILVSTANNKCTQIVCSPGMYDFEIFGGSLIIRSKSFIDIYPIDIESLEIDYARKQICDVAHTAGIPVNAFRNDGVVYHVDKHRNLLCCDVLAFEPKVDVLFTFPIEEGVIWHNIFVYKVENACLFFTLYTTDSSGQKFELGVLNLDTKLMRSLYKCDQKQIRSDGIDIANGLIFIANVINNTIIVLDLDTGKEIGIVKPTHKMDEKTVGHPESRIFCSNIRPNTYIKFEDDTLFYFSRDDEGPVMHAIDFSK